MIDQDYINAGLRNINDNFRNEDGSRKTFEQMNKERLLFLDLTREKINNRLEELSKGAEPETPAEPMTLSFSDTFARAEEERIRARENAKEKDVEKFTKNRYW